MFLFVIYISVNKYNTNCFACSVTEKLLCIICIDLARLVSFLLDLGQAMFPCYQNVKTISIALIQFQWICFFILQKCKMVKLQRLCHLIFTCFTDQIKPQNFILFENFKLRYMAWSRVIGCLKNNRTQIDSSIYCIILNCTYPV